MAARSSPDQEVSSAPLVPAAWLQLSALDFFSDTGPPLPPLPPPLRTFFLVLDGLVFPLVPLAFLAPALALTLVFLGLVLPGAALAISVGARSSGLRKGERLSRSRLNLTPMEPRPADAASLAGVVLLTPSRMSTATLDCSFTFREEQDDDEDEEPEPLLTGGFGGGPEEGADSLGGRAFLDDLSLSLSLSLSRSRSPPSSAFRRDPFSREEEEEEAAPERRRSFWLLLPPRSSPLSPSESYRTSRLGDEAGAGEGPRGSDLSSRPTVMVRLMAKRSWSVRSWMEGGTAPRRRLSRSPPEVEPEGGGAGAGTFSLPSPDRFSPRDRDRFFFFLLPPPSRCFPRCRSRLEDDDEEVAGGGEAERRRRRRFSRDRDLRLPPRRRSVLRERRRAERERERERRRVDDEAWEPGLRSRERCFLESQGEAGAGGGGWVPDEDEAASLASPLRLRSLLDFLRVGGPAAAAGAGAGAGEGERWR